MARTPRRNGVSDTFNSNRDDTTDRERRDWSPEWDHRDGDQRERGSMINRLDSYNVDESRHGEFRDNRDGRDGEFRDDAGRRNEEYRRTEGERFGNRQTQSSGRGQFGYSTARRDTEDNWTGRSRGDEYRQEDFESLSSYNRPADRDSGRRSDNRDFEGRYQVPGRADSSGLRSDRYGYANQGINDRGDNSPMNRYGQDFGRQSFEGYGRGFAPEGDRSLAGVGPRNYKRSDERIKEDVCESLSAHPWIDASNTDVEVKGGIVTLTGTVRDRQARRMIEDLAETVSGVTDVECQIKVDSKAGQMDANKINLDGTKDKDGARHERAGSMSGSGVVSAGKDR